MARYVTMRVVFFVCCAWEGVDDASIAWERWSLRLLLLLIDVHVSLSSAYTPLLLAWLLQIARVDMVFLGVKQSN